MYHNVLTVLLCSQQGKGQQGPPAKKQKLDSGKSKPTDDIVSQAANEQLNKYLQSTSGVDRCVAFS